MSEILRKTALMLKHNESRNAKRTFELQNTCFASAIGTVFPNSLRQRLMRSRLRFSITLWEMGVLWRHKKRESFSIPNIIHWVQSIDRIILTTNIENISCLQWRQQIWNISKIWADQFGAPRTDRAAPERAQDPCAPAFKKHRKLTGKP